jgi:hypothetical protein
MDTISKRKNQRQNNIANEYATEKKYYLDQNLKLPYKTPNHSWLQRRSEMKNDYHSDSSMTSLIKGNILFFICRIVRK